MFQEKGVRAYDVGYLNPLRAPVDVVGHIDAKILVAFDSLEWSVDERDSGGCFMLAEMHDFALAGVKTHEIVFTPLLDRVGYILR